MSSSQQAEVDLGINQENAEIGKQPPPTAAPHSARPVWPQDHLGSVSRSFSQPRTFLSGWVIGQEPWMGSDIGLDSSSTRRRRPHYYYCTRTCAKSERDSRVSMYRNSCILSYLVDNSQPVSVYMIAAAQEAAHGEDEEANTSSTLRPLPPPECR